VDSNIGQKRVQLSTNGRNRDQSRQGTNPGTKHYVALFKRRFSDGVTPYKPFFVMSKVIINPLLKGVRGMLDGVIVFREL
jgi:hypothetical protein